MEGSKGCRQKLRQALAGTESTGSRTNLEYLNKTYEVWSEVMPFPWLENFSQDGDHRVLRAGPKPPFGLSRATRLLEVWVPPSGPMDGLSFDLPTESSATGRMLQALKSPPTDPSSNSTGPASSQSAELTGSSYSTATPPPKPLRWPKGTNSIWDRSDRMG